MKTKTMCIITILSIIAVIGGMILNFNEFLMGKPATVMNLVVTALYIITWILILIIGIKSKHQGIIMYCVTFWLIMIFLASVTVYVNLTENTVSWIIPLAALLLGQWYGIMFYFKSFATCAIIITIISWLMFLISLIGIKYLKYRKS